VQVDTVQIDTVQIDTVQVDTVQIDTVQVDTVCQDFLFCLHEYPIRTQYAPINLTETCGLGNYFLFKFIQLPLPRTLPDPAQPNSF